MKSRPWLSSTSALIVFFCSALPGQAATNVVSGTLTSHTTWSGANLLQGTVVVPTNVVLTIEPGARVLMTTDARLRIEGQLIADGTPEDPISFTRSAVGARWKQIMFVRAQNSRFRHCIFEFADCAGSQLAYYDNDCDPNTPPPARTYTEAIVLLASHVDFEGCTFRNLLGGSGDNQGDAIAVISDDPQIPGAASAHIRNSQFISIGQGVHTRYSYVLVENCFFTLHNGDNDDVDLYGESNPPPLILNNVFLNPRDDDMINPTRCSAIIIGNIIAGSSDHGIVLRDRGSPVLINNLIYNCTSAGIAVQNQCDALLVNNTIVNCGRGIRFFDHTGRWGAPYCLTPGSGRATIINTIIWDCPTTLLLADTTFAQDRGSHATVLYSNIQGGQSRTSVSANSTLTWGPGNINADPQFVNATTNNYRLRPTSPCIDAGTNPNAFLTNVNLIVSADFDGMPRPLDGTGNGEARFDIGAFEFLLATADSNGDGIPDGWLHRHGLNPTNPDVGSGDPDNDGLTTFQEWIADTDPTNPLSNFRIQAISNAPVPTLFFMTSSNRQYTLYYSTNLAIGSAGWTNVPGQVKVQGTGSLDSLADPDAAPEKFYRVGVELP
jgi:parallel beta-helix repeat protein